MEINEFLKTLTADPKARELLKSRKEPKDGREAVRQYAEIAKELGLSVPQKGLEAFLALKEKVLKERAEKAGETVKEALSEASLGSVAGGDGADSCESTFDAHEWCWFSDSCSVVINGYSGIKEPDLGDNTPPAWVVRAPEDENGEPIDIGDWQNVETMPMLDFDDDDREGCLSAVGY